MKTIDELLRNVKKVHFIGIGGSGMCPIAEILLARGYEVSGSDNNDTETFRKIEKDGAKVFLGQVKENIAPDTELVIYTKAVLKGNEELEYALANFPTFERAEILGALSRLYSNCIGVCGTHGKTTTTSMITQVLLDAGLDPSAVIGGRLAAIDAYGRYGSSENFVCESCEFKDTFLHMNPDVCVMLNVDADHLDYFKTLDGVKASFRKFAELTTRTVIYNGDDKNTLDTLKGLEGKRLISVGLGENNEWRAEKVVPHGAAYTFDVFHLNEFVTSVRLNVPGEHNVLNALCAFAAAYESGAAPQAIADSLSEFGGAARRFEMLGTYGGVTFADDYAHHPAEIKVTLEAAKKMDYQRIWAVHQPFTYSRTKEFLNDFAEVLSIADCCVITALMPGREPYDPTISSADLCEKIDGAVLKNTFEEASDYVCANAKSGDLVITLGCGDVYKASRMMCQKMKESCGE